MLSNLLILIIFNFITYLILYKVSFTYNLLDFPNDRKKHIKATPLIGGLIFYLSLLFSIYLFEFPEHVNNIIIYSGLIVLTGILDDFYDLKVPTRIILIFIACYLLISNGLLLENIGQYNNHIINLGAFGIIFTILSVAGLTNAFNFLDGTDGLLLSQVIISYLLLFIFCYFNMNDFFLINFFVVIITLSLLGLFYNFGIFNKSKIFLGDSGSMFFGFSFGFLLIFISNQENILFHKILVIWTVAFPIMDFMSTIFRRMLKRKSPFSPDRTHFHHMLINLNINNFIIIFGTSFLSIILGLSGYLLTLTFGPLYSLLSFVLIGIVFIYLSIKLEKNLNLGPKIS